MLYKVMMAVFLRCIQNKHRLCKHHVEFLNVKFGGGGDVK